MLDKYKDMYKFQQQARQIQKELKQTKFEGSSSNGVVTVIANGMQEVLEVKIDFQDKGEYYLSNPQRLGTEIVDTSNKVLKKAQKASAERMQSIMGGSGLPGM
ncbi:MAG: YbaB/EbfC family nucleoid-associated protein [Candidatus Gracilibacteria bacterium]|nr:YbaB/EbfC family nucleoid-associated protein [Candidatus Gracilibacteria bacterium]